MTYNPESYSISKSGTHFHPGTPQNIISAIDHCISAKIPVRVFNGDPETGEVWPCEFEVYGQMSRTMGPAKSPIICHPRSIGGSLVDARSVLGILTSNQRWVHKSPKLDLGTWVIEDEDELQDYEVRTLHNGQIHSRHKKRSQAERYVAFMTGKRLAP